MSSKRNLQNNGNEPFFCQGGVEVRSRESGGKTIFGYWAVYNRRSFEMRTKKGVRFVEVILPGAFDRTDFSDVRSMFDHERFLAAPPTLRHGLDSVGAWYEIDYDPLDPDHVAVMRKIERGDAKGSSFEFSPPSSEDQTITEKDGVKLREIRHIPQVFEFGPVVTPAYPQTTAFVRSLDEAHDEDLNLQQAQQHAQQQAEQQEFARRKLEADKFLANALS